MFAGAALAGDEPLEILSGDWGFSRILVLPDGAWDAARVGAMARYEKAWTRTVPSVNPLESKRISIVSQHERILKARNETEAVFKVRDRPSKKNGKPGAWEAFETRKVPIGKIQPKWDVKLVGERTFRLGDSIEKAKAYRVRFDKQSWVVVASKEYGVLSAHQETEPRIEWKLLDANVEFKVGTRKIRCRRYRVRWTQKKERKTREYLLCEKVPGYVVQTGYFRGMGLGGYVTETLIAFR